MNNFFSSPPFRAAFSFIGIVVLTACAITSPDINPQPVLPTRVVNVTASLANTNVPKATQANATVAPTLPPTLTNTATMTFTPSATTTASATPTRPTSTPTATLTPTATFTSTSTPVPVGFGFISRLNPKDAPTGSIEIASYDGVKVAADSFSLRVDAEYIGYGDFEAAAKKLADGKHPVIVVVGSDLTAATRKAASTYPYVKFVGVDQQSDDALLSNLSFVTSRSDEEGFIAGMVSGYLTKSRVVAVMVPNNNNFEAKRYSNGFTQGVRYSCGICQTIVVQIDVEKENGTEAITRLQRQKTDVLLPALNHTLGAEVTKFGATTGGLWVIGLGRDYGVTLNGGSSNRIAMSILRKPDEVLTQLIKTLMSGGSAKVVTLSATNNSLRLSPKFASEISPAAIRLMKDSFDLLASGLLDVGVDFATGDVK